MNQFKKLTLILTALLLTIPSVYGMNNHKKRKRGASSEKDLITAKRIKTNEISGEECIQSAMQTIKIEIEKAIANNNPKKVQYLINTGFITEKKEINELLESTQENKIKAQVDTQEYSSDINRKQELQKINEIELIISAALFKNRILIPVETYFIPQDKDSVKPRLWEFLNSAKQQILVAMYWLKDELIIKKLIELKKNNIDVQIIFDESLEQDDWNKGAIKKTIQQLKRNKILPIIFPSKIVTKKKNKYYQKMHDKFLVVDSKKVWTGSANFTHAGLHNNHENVNILNSKNNAERYKKTFFDIETNIFNFYICFLLEKINNLPQWFIRLVATLRTKHNTFKKTVEGLQSQDQQLIEQQTPWKPATQYQKTILEKNGMQTNLISQEEASEIQQEIAREKYRRRRPFYSYKRS